MDWDESDPKSRHQLNADLKMSFSMALRAALGCSPGVQGVLFHSLLSPIRGSRALGHSSGAPAGQAALQGAVAKPHVLHCDPLQTCRDRARRQVQNTGKPWTPLPSSGG